MKTKFLLISGIAAATVLAGGWALAQSPGHEHGAAGTAQHTQSMGAHAMGHAQMKQMMQHMGHGKRQAMTHGGPGTTQPQAPQSGAEAGSAHQH